MPNPKHVELLKRSIEEWNWWRSRSPKVKPDLTNANLRGADLNRANLCECDMANADLTRASLIMAELYEANLTGANLHGALLLGTNLRRANFTEANLTEVNLTDAVMVEAILSGATLRYAVVYGASVWNVKTDEQTRQYALIITSGRDEPIITVDDLNVAQFIHLLLTNEKVRSGIDAVTSKVVLILGRFTDERKRVLDALREELRVRGFSPVIFDWVKPSRRDLTETVQLLANLARFVIADITDAKSIPQELSHIIPLLPSVPVQPIIRASEREYGMFEHWQRFVSVLPAFRYEDQASLIASIESAVLNPVEEWERGYDATKALEDRLRALEEENRQLRAQVSD